ncbi:MAG: hypothetical protein ACJ762_15895 [Solirubrobacteraceae bacterium]
MSRSLIAALAALAVLVLVPVSGAQASAGGSCAIPLRYHLSDNQVAAIDTTFSQNVQHGPLTIHSDGGDPFGGTIFEVRALAGYQVCAVRGYYRSGDSFFLPGTAGGAAVASFAKRRFLRSSPFSARSVIVSYAEVNHRTSRSCDNPLVVYAASGTDGRGDTGARIRTSLAVDGRTGRSTVTASWQLATGSRLCGVAGWNSHGHAWHRGGAGDGHHVMYSDVAVGNHDNSELYLWIAFTR